MSDSETPPSSHQLQLRTNLIRLGHEVPPQNVTSITHRGAPRGLISGHFRLKCRCSLGGRKMLAARALEPAASNPARGRERVSGGEPLIARPVESTRGKPEAEALEPSSQSAAFGARVEEATATAPQEAADAGGRRNANMSHHSSVRGEGLVGKAGFLHPSNLSPAPPSVTAIFDLFETHARAQFDTYRNLHRLWREIMVVPLRARHELGASGRAGHEVQLVSDDELLAIAGKVLDDLAQRVKVAAEKIAADAGSRHGQSIPQ